MKRFRPLAAKGGPPPASQETQAPSRAAPTTKQRRYRHKNEEWELRRATISTLYHDEDKSVDEIVAILARDGFIASRRQYLNKFNLWGLQKNIRQNDMKILVAKGDARMARMGKKTTFFLNGQPLAVECLERFKNRQFIRQGR
ncbi:hypothetical protein QBC33DRAFT_566210 [Phialemonium atrogriseum]|uniref:Clr5 domain-containing protein n=1 Tax=Phialemonium atrogriseum TaxID=1093897 RepID=A0AAJ0FLE0_9PEZI|nr:uncharacterized protein QBC33DRAFT_566210 [Phialemonium atrogriseum]KAK1772077.1 hypothetical protein QBC33DRAFT_566210 [Phialemonium atrogriseum]